MIDKPPLPGNKILSENDDFSSFRIVEWESKFESDSTEFVRLPIMFDDESYQRLMQLKDGASVFGCFVLTLEVAAISEQRGTFTRPQVLTHSLVDPVAIENAIEVLSSPEFNWIEEVSQ